MSKNLKDERDFLINLLRLKDKSSKKLLFTATSKQLQALAEIFYNIGVLPLPHKYKKKLARYRKLLKEFVYDNLNRDNWLKKHYRLTLKILRLIRVYIRQILG